MASSKKEFFASSVSNAWGFLKSLPKETTIGLIGSPGVGKSAWAKAMADHLKAKHLVICELCFYQVEDLMGLPRVDGAYTVWVPPAIFFPLLRDARICSKCGEQLIVDAFHEKCPKCGATKGDLVPPMGKDEHAILLLDDIATATEAVQNAALSIVYERKIGSVHLHPGVKIILTANRRSDKSNAYDLPAALINRMFVMEFKANFEDWWHWYLEDPGNKGLPLEIPYFLKWKPECFTQLPTDGDELARFATPRAWHSLAMAIRDMGPAFDRGTPSRAGNAFFVAAGFVGNGSANAFEGYCKNWGRFSKLDLQELLKDPEKGAAKLKDTDISERHALLGALVSYVVNETREAEDKKDPAKTRPVIDALYKSLFQALRPICQKDDLVVFASVTLIRTLSHNESTRCSEVLQKVDAPLHRVIVSSLVDDK